MTEIDSIRLNRLPSHLRKMLALFLITLSCAYLIGLGYIYFNTKMTFTGISEEFRGSETRMEFEKPAGEMFQTVHNHMFGLSLTFLLTGTLFYFSSFPGGTVKMVLLTEPFLSVFLSFGSFWLVRYVSPVWTWLLLASGALMAVGFFLQVSLSLFDLIVRPIYDSH